MHLTCVLFFKASFCISGFRAGLRWQLLHALQSRSFRSNLTFISLSSETHLHLYSLTQSSLPMSILQSLPTRSRQVRSPLHPSCTFRRRSPPPVCIENLQSVRWLPFPQVGVHPDHHLVLHRQPGRLPHRAEDGGAHRVGGRPGGSDGDRVRHHARRIHHDLLPGSGGGVCTHAHTGPT